MITSNDFTMQATESRIFVHVLVTGPVFARTILCEVSCVNITTAYLVYHGKQGNKLLLCTSECSSQQVFHENFGKHGHGQQSLVAWMYITITTFQC